MKATTRVSLTLVLVGILALLSVPGLTGAGEGGDLGSFELGGDLFWPRRQSVRQVHALYAAGVSGPRNHGSWTRMRMCATVGKVTSTFFPLNPVKHIYKQPGSGASIQAKAAFKRHHGNFSL